MSSLASNICKFLVENGADVDAIEKDPSGQFLGWVFI